MDDLGLLAVAMGAVLGLAGCDVAKSEGADADADRDGVTADAGDCDDYNNRVYPGADEVSRDGLDADCDGEDGPIVVSDSPGEVPFADFVAACDARGGVVQMHAACAGTNACRGMSYGDWGEGAQTFEHTCRAMNYCNGWSCVETAAGEGRDGAAVYDALCAGCHGWNGPLTTADADGDTVEVPQFTVFVNPGVDPAAALEAFQARTAEDLRTTLAFGVAGRATSGRAFSNMPGYHDKLSRTEIDAAVAHVRAMPLTTHTYSYPDGSN